ncbi:hypothetical protein CHBEV_323 [Choristoneura biennis entomopoxvirus]|uniref:Uncharacterized protein n=1 Tax=Choristoneura biennis entomopoxvirus TaxID=10288 RepID=A0A916P1A1_CBEPV|nr:hypothetical protein CHBEV_012 [Choristoneura biennis entomopoxvirus]YP_008004393.1 hypothetical protein CHBEV_323 [Choristoneura biennis entomopoxvirus]CCU55580.1 hypothetical protein CHBEV_012 [Choristoneura biennis entomopoxvirus]CCU55891.1 hypothetical protein CHBEV_323 [Choristoneura biennis entomopoxvirus]
MCNSSTYEEEIVVEKQTDEQTDEQTNEQTNDINYLFTNLRDIENNLEILNKNINDVECEHYRLLKQIYNAREIYDNISENMTIDHYDYFIRLLIEYSDKIFLLYFNTE